MHVGGQVSFFNMHSSISPSLCRLSLHDIYVDMVHVPIPIQWSGTRPAAEGHRQIYCKY